MVWTGKRGMTASGPGCVGGHSALVATVTEECFSPSPSLREKQCQAWLSTYTGEKGNYTVSTVAGHPNSGDKDTGEYFNLEIQFHLLYCRHQENPLYSKWIKVVLTPLPLHCGCG